MATRMQQRRGTAAQWTAANPILAAGEIGFETDTSKFKMGNGSSAWSALTYFANAAELAAIIDAAPATLDTLNELAAALGDDPAFFTTMATNLSNHASDTSGVHGIEDTYKVVITDATQTLTNKTLTSPAITTPTGLVKSDVGLSNVNNTADADKPISTATQASLDLKAEITGPTFLGTVSLPGSTSIGTVSAAEVSYLSGVTSALQTQIDAKANTSSPTFTGTVSGITKSMVGLGNVDNTSDDAKPVSTAQASAIATAKSEAIADATSQVTAVIASAPGALNTLDELAAALGDDANFASTVTTSLASKAPIESPTFTGTVSGITKSMVGLGNVDNTSDENKPVSTATQTALALKASLANPTFTGTVSGITKNMVGLSNVDNTSDANKPVSSATQTALDLKAPKDTPVFTNLVTVGASGIAFTDGTQTKEGVPSRTSFVQKTGSYTLASLTERDSVIEVNSASAVTISIPTDASTNYPVGTSIDILQTGAGQVTIAAVTPGTTTVNATPGLKLRTQWSSATLLKRAANTWVVVGDLTA
jgi:hypothetical protein